MGNNAAYSIFKHTIITIYNHGALTLALLDALAKEYAGTDIDSGGDTGLLTKDGKTLEEVCIGIIDPAWVPVKNNENGAYYNEECWEDEERNNKWSEITYDRWGWR